MSDPLRPFVAEVLLLAGLEHVWLSDGLVRVKAHPAFPDLFRDLPDLDLALGEDAMRACPTATPCLPGSFALDQLLQWTASMPGAFSTRLEAGAAALPPSLPPVANGELSKRSVEPGARRLLYALFRVSLHSDELVERLVPIAMSEDGTPRPDLLPHLESRPRAEARRPAPLPDGLLEAVEREAERLAGEITREHLPAVEARKAAEIRRLEEYLRALQD